MLERYVVKTFIYLVKFDLLNLYNLFFHIKPFGRK